MKKFLKKYAILFFFCGMMGGIIMLDCIFAVAFMDKRRGIAADFSDDTKKISIVQADTQESFLQREFDIFLQRRKESGKINLLKYEGEGGAELYSNDMEYFTGDDSQNCGVWLRQDEYDNWAKTDEKQFYYKGSYYDVLGSYGKKEAEEKYIINMQAEFENHPEAAVKGVYYLDCGMDTNRILEELQSEILAKNQYAQIAVLEEAAKGRLMERLFQSTDAMYYLLQMGVLVLLNLFNFGNIAGYWVSARKTEIFVRKMVGGNAANIFLKLSVLFITMTGAFIAVGMLAGAALAGLQMKITNEALGLGFVGCATQWLVLALFEGAVLWKQVRKPMMEIKKQG